MVHGGDPAEGRQPQHPDEPGLETGVREANGLAGPCELLTVVVFRREFTSVAITLWALSCGLALAANANAGPFEDAEAAVRRGDYATALQLFQTLADQGNTHAQRNVGIMYLKGQGVPQNIVQATKWIRTAADGGLAEAQNEVGIFYQRGWGVERNDTEAVKWYRRAADQGLVASQVNLAD